RSRELHCHVPGGRQQTSGQQRCFRRGRDDVCADGSDPPARLRAASGRCRSRRWRHSHRNLQMSVRATPWVSIALASFLFGLSGRAVAQEPEPQTRAGQIEKEEQDKQVHEYQPGAAEYWLDRAERILTTGMKWHPFFDSAYSGGGFTLGAGYRK